MSRRPTHPARIPTALLAGAVVACASAVSFDASANLLDEPPRVVSLKLDDPASPRLPLLRAFRDAATERPGPVRLYTGGLWGRWGGEAWWSLAWRGASSDQPPLDEVADDAVGEAARRFGAEALGFLVRAEQPLESLAGAEPPLAFMGRANRRLEFLGRAESPLELVRAASSVWLDWLGEGPLTPLFASTGASISSDGFDGLWVTPPKVIPWQERCRRRPVTFVRYGGESARFALVGCDGSVAPEALDRLSIVARPPEVPNPGELLPDEPDPTAWESGEWMPGVHLANPRLLWLLQRIADAFPWRTVYVFSGYRPKYGATPRSHTSLHGEARAMDINVMGVPNASLFLLCRTLDDVGCGFYPNSKFVHVDVRRPGTGRAFWIDVSGPGEPSKYVDSWPGVVDSGGLAWDASAH